MSRNAGSYDLQSAVDSGEVSRRLRDSARRERCQVILARAKRGNLVGVVRQCKQPAATLLRRVERSRAQIAIMGFRFPSLKAIAIPQIVSRAAVFGFSAVASSAVCRSVDTVSGSRVSARGSGNRGGQRSRDETGLSFANPPRQENSRTNYRDTFHYQVNYLRTRGRASSGIANVRGFFFSETVLNVYVVL